MRFTAYWQLAFVSEMSYKTTLLEGRLDVSSAGMRLFAVLWLLCALGWITGGLLLAFRTQVWAQVMLAAVLLSMILYLLDWRGASRGFWIDIIFVIVLFFVFGFRMKPSPFPDFSGTPVYPTEIIAFRLGFRPRSSVSTTSNTLTADCLSIVLRC